MKWSWNIGRYAGIDVFIHATFLLLIGFVAVSYWMRGADPAGIVEGVLFILALFVCVLLHEFGHALTARRYGIRTRDITLLPIGGIARLERMPDKPVQELWVALAGPAVNLVIAAALFAVLVAMAGLVPLSDLSVTGGPFLERLLMANLFLVGFNLLPAFPMDGGRVFRALLAMRMEYVRATSIAATVGQGMALVFGFAGLIGNPFLLFIAFFVWIGASQESSMTQMKSALAGIPVQRVMITNYQTVTPTEPLTAVVEHILRGSQVDFPVVESGKPVGVLTRGDLLIALSQKGMSATVGDVMRRDLAVAESTEMLEGVFQRLQTCECHTMPVVRQGQLVGLITMDNVTELLLIQSALKQDLNLAKA